jgi:hypothetical protein
LRLYSDNGTTLHRQLPPCRPSRPTRWRHGTLPVPRLPHTRLAAAPASAGYVTDSLALTPHQTAHPLHRRSVFTVIAQNFTGIITKDFDLHAAIHAMAHTALSSF